MVNSSNFREKCLDLQRGKLSCEENVRYFLSNLEKSNEKYNIVLELNKAAVDRAKTLDKKRAAKEKLGHLFGLVICIKSNITAIGLGATCASKTLENFTSSYNADCVQKLLDEDAIIIASLNCDEFASGSGGENSAYGKTLNPKCPDRIPGGSSSGPAAAIAADFCDIALGTDTGGSIRNPASHCGIVGIKPSYGRVSRHGLIDLAMSLDQVGPLTDNLYASALLLSVIAGPSPNDATTLPDKVPDYTEHLSAKKNFVIGRVKEFDELIHDKEIKSMFESTCKELKEKGHTIQEVSLGESIKLAIQAYYPLVYTEFFSGTRKFDSIKYGKVIEDTTGNEALRRILGGKEISRSEYDGAYYKKALATKELISQAFDKVFTQVDCIISPVTPKLPHIFGTKLTPEEEYAYDAFTIPANLAGICAGVVPKEKVKLENDEVPLGIQVMANKLKEDILFEVLSLFEEK